MPRKLPSHIIDAGEGTVYGDQRGDHHPADTVAGNHVVPAYQPEDQPTDEQADGGADKLRATYIHVS